jgi:glycosyltransferase involved in cell wall biosynthesis
MKVLRVLPELDFGGVESRLQVQAQLHDRQAYELVACCFHKLGRTGKALQQQGLRVDVLGIDPSPRNPATTLALARYLRRLRPDVVHASIAEANLHCLLAGRLAGVPVVIAEETGMPSHSRLARVVFRGAYRFASTIVGVTQAVCEYVRTIDKAPAGRVRVIYNCANPAYFPEPRVDPRPAQGPSLRLILVGRLVPVKNHAFFLEVLEKVLPRYPHVQVQIAGDGPLREELATAVASRNLSRQVSMLGVRSDVRELLNDAHVFALPSLSEGCSVSLIEAMASGAQVIGSDVPGIHEVMGPLAQAWTAPARDPAAWLSLLERAFTLPADQRAALAAQGQQRAYELFSPSAYVQTLAAMYRELAGAANELQRH